MLFFTEQISNCSQVATAPRIRNLTPRVARELAPKGASRSDGSSGRARPSSPSTHYPSRAVAVTPQTTRGGIPTIILIILLVLLFGGGGYRTYHHGYRDGGGL